MTALLVVPAPAVVLAGIRGETTAGRRGGISPHRRRLSITRVGLVWLR